MFSINEKKIDIRCDLYHIENRNSLLNLPAISNQLTKGLLDVFEIPLNNLDIEIRDLIFRQQKCITETQQQNKKLCNLQEDVELNDLFLTVENYYTKLMNIKQDVMLVHEKLAKLKKRALRFQLAKQKGGLQTGRLQMEKL